MNDKPNRRFNSAPSHAPGNGATVEQNVVSAAQIEQAFDEGKNVLPFFDTKQAKLATPFASEGGHWYLPDGTPFYTVLGKTTGKPRPTTLKDARPVLARPSSTTVIKATVPKPGLMNWQERELFKAFLDTEFDATDDFEVAFKKVKERSRQKAAIAADRGKKVHKSVEQTLRGEALSDHSHAPLIGKVARALKPFDIDLTTGESERTFCNEEFGYGGCCDWSRREVPAVCDYKTKDEIIEGKELAYKEHPMQIASYIIGRGLPLLGTRGLSVFIGVDDSEVRVLEWSQADLLIGWEQFLHCLWQWQLDKQYGPLWEQFKQEKGIGI